jgi:hypothetical protein
MPLEDIADRRAADAQAQLPELAMDPTVSPPRVLARQPQDQRLEVGADVRPAAAWSLREGPLPAHQVAMPA